MGHSEQEKSTDIRTELREMIAHLEHVLPAQAPIRDFVHHNTLHGFQHLSFPDALTATRQITGANGYLPENEFRKFYTEGRIHQRDLEAILNEDGELAVDNIVLETDQGTLRRLDVYLTALIHPLKPATASQLNWQIDEADALQRFQVDVAKSNKEHLLQNAKRHGINTEQVAISDLWAACLEVLGLEHYALHPEELLDLAPEQAEGILSELAASDDKAVADQPLVHRLVRKEAERLLQQLIERVGADLTLCGLLQLLTGKDILESMQPVLIRHVATYLDQGLAAWHHQNREQGFFHNWRQGALNDLSWVFDNLDHAEAMLESLPVDPLEVIVSLLQRLGLPRARWASYLERLALELPGWSGMFLWRHNHPDYEGLAPSHVEMLHYLAVRLVLEQIFAQQICHETWGQDCQLDVLQGYFRRHRSELVVRHILFSGRLPEYLITLAQRLVQRDVQQQVDYPEWIQLADRIWTWRHSPAADRPIGHNIYRSGWRLFRLAQHLGLCGAQIRQLNKAGIDAIFDSLNKLTPDRVGYLWLQAYERHYRDQMFNVLSNNRGRGRWRTRQQRPAAQLVFCMDDREESLRRHLEELVPTIETLGAAGFFGVSINWRGLDDQKVTALCPVTVTPAHEIRELAKQSPALLAKHRNHRRRRIWLKEVLNQEIRRNLISAAGLIVLAAPLALITLTGKIVAPRLLGQFSARLREKVDTVLATEVMVTASGPAPADSPRLGFTDQEQAERVENFLRTIGLTSDFAPLVAMMGHGSISLNNPHLAAYDCGACSGRHGGPNARVFAAMANRPEVRDLLKKGGIHIPQDTWFLGGEHNTCDDSITWYDTDAIPDILAGPFALLKQQTDQATQLSAHERCRRLASAPKAPTPWRALKHVVGRSLDFSQARPELGHATNAAAFIGRRSISQGTFLDRRVFLISYDPSIDPEGEVLENLLLAAGPVGAGISLEYYFSTVNNQYYGSGTKVTHNVTGLFGVMDGASSDLRTGLPQQMIEIHEAMRLQIVVEARTEVLARIYGRQPILQELIGNGWVLLNAIDPDSGIISVFNPAVGFETWENNISPLPRVNRSQDWYTGYSGPLSFALIEDGPHD